jgi:hypothetical protein
MSRIAGRILLVALATLLLPAGAFARSKTDLVFLVNGDRLTGEIKQLDRGILNLSTNALSTVAAGRSRLAPRTGPRGSPASEARA